MEPRLLPKGAAPSGQGAVPDGLQHPVPAAAVKDPHPVQVGLEIPLPEKEGQGVLLDGRDGAGIEAQLLPVRLRQGGGRTRYPMRREGARVREKVFR